MGFERTAARGVWRRGPARAPDGQGMGAAFAEPQAESRVRHGGCLCGKVRYALTGEPLRVGLCHCEDCRKATGGTALHYADFPRAAFTHSGRLATFGGRSFCPECGGRVVHLSDGEAEVNLGSLDDPPTDLVPEVEGWTVRREPWMPPVPGARQFEGDPD